MKKSRLLALLAAVLVVAVAAACNPITPRYEPPAQRTDPYVAVAYEAEQISQTLDVVYGTGVTDAGETIDLKLDVFSPPDTGVARPLIVLVHGGSFRRGSKEMMHPAAIQWAQRGYVAVSIQYRLATVLPRPGEPSPAELAGADGQLAMRWLRANAESYSIDPDRVAMLGSSAGGGISLIAGMSTDLNAELDQDRPLPDASHVPNAVIATGATLIVGIENGLVAPGVAAAPVMMHHFQQDSVTGEPVASAYATCDVWVAGGQPCFVVETEGAGHVTSLQATGPLNFGWFMPFLADELDLASASAP